MKERKSHIKREGSPPKKIPAEDNSRELMKGKAASLEIHNYDLLNRLPDIIMQVDVNKVYTWANRAGIEFFGEDVLGQEASFYFEGAQNTYFRVESLFKGDENVFYVESWQRRRDGQKRLLAWWCSVLKDHKGRVIGALSTARDVTGQKQVENELRRSEERYKGLVTSLPDAVLVMDIDGRIDYASRQTLRLHGYKSEKELIGSKFLDLISPESKAQAIIYLHKTLKEGFVYNQEYTMLKKNGERFIGEISTSLIKDENNKPIQFAATIRDITERKKFDTQLKRSIKEKEFLLQEIHHRVKNNLQIISSILDMSSMRIKDKKAIDLIAGARSKIQSMAFIHSQLYKSERFEKIEMGAHIEELISYLLEVYALGKNITPYIDIKDVFLSLTQAIPCALIMNELISNALKHAFKPDQKGIIEISMKVMGPKLLAYIRDNGIGMEDSIDIHTTNSLGLKLVKNLIEKQLKGSFKVKKNKYTEFSFDFYLEEEEAKNA
jgi:PAS domain S-box-containing protein